MTAAEQITSRFRGRVAIDPEECRLACAVAGALWLLGGVTLPIFALLPGTPRRHEAVIMGVAVFAASMGALSLVLARWRHVTATFIHVSYAAALVAIAVTVASS